MDTGGLRKGGNIEMKEGFQIGRTDGRIYAMGVTAVAGGMHFSYASKGKSCALLLYKKEGTAPLARILFPDGLRRWMGRRRRIPMAGSLPAWSIGEA